MNRTGANRATAFDCAPIILPHSQTMTFDARPEPTVPDEVTRALDLFALVQPVTQEHLAERYRDLLRIWHPHRHASLTNNPRKYMEMYKKGEAMSKEIESAYRVISAWLSRSTP